MLSSFLGRDAGEDVELEALTILIWNDSTMIIIVNMKILSLNQYIVIDGC